MYDKIKAQLKVKYPGVPDKVLDAIAKKIATKVTEESAIEGGIAEFDTVVGVQDFANTIQSEGDRRVTEAINKAKKPDAPPPQDTPPTDVPAWAKDLLNEVKTLKTEKQRETLLDTLNKKLAEKKIPALMAKGRVVEKEEDIEAVLAEIEADYTAIRQGTVNETVENNKPTVIGGNQKVDAIDAEIKAWSEKGTDKSSPTK